MYDYQITKLIESMQNQANMQAQIADQLEQMNVILKAIADKMYAKEEKV